MLDVKLLQRRAKFVYELARLRAAARVVVVAFVLTALCTWETGAVLRSAGLGLALFVVATALRWRLSRGFQAVSVGLWAGSVPLIVALGLCRFAPFCPPNVAFTVCGSVGLVSGLFMGREFAAAKHLTSRHWLGASIVAILTATMGCVALGVGTAVGAASGVMLGSAVTARLMRRTAA